jgi:hypothetical protein
VSEKFFNAGKAGQGWFSEKKKGRPSGTTLPLSAAIKRTAEGVEAL